MILKEGLQHNPTYHLTAQALPGLNPLDHASRLTLLPHQDVQHLAWHDVNDDDGGLVDDGDSDGLGLYLSYADENGYDNNDNPHSNDDDDSDGYGLGLSRYEALLLR